VLAHDAAYDQAMTSMPATPAALDASGRSECHLIFAKRGEDKAASSFPGQRPQGRFEVNIGAAREARIKLSSKP